VRTAVVGHVEWIEFVRVESLPAPGEIVRAPEFWEEPGGGGAVAAVQLARLAGGCAFFTALGDDVLGRRSHEELTQLGLTMHAVFRPEPQRRAITYIDASGERTITVIGERLHARAGDALPWDELGECDAVYVTAGDPDAIRLARRARVVVATSRILPDLEASGVELDALVGSSVDAAERYAEGDLSKPPRLVVRTAGDGGGTFRVRGGEDVRYDAVEPDAAVVDTYGAGDSFAAGLTFALGRGLDAAEAVAFAATCGAAVLTGRGPYEAQRRL
jgi:ribokinase